MATDDEFEEMMERIQEIQNEIAHDIEEVIKTFVEKFQSEPHRLQAVAAALVDLSVAFNADILREGVDTEDLSRLIDKHIEYYRGCLEVAASRPPVGHPPVTH